jgi:DNA polymerase-3 subunit epsilon
VPPIREIRFCAIDFESAGAARGQTDCPVQVATAGWSVESGHADPFDSYLRVDREIHWAASKVHRITREHLAGAPSLLELWPQLQPRLAGAWIVAHGKGTEKRFLRAFPGHRFGPWVDTLLVARAAWPDAPDHSLGALCDALNLTQDVRALVPQRTWHDALFDATASLVLLAHLVNAQDLAELPAEVLLNPNTSRWSRTRRV